MNILLPQQKLNMHVLPIHLGKSWSLNVSWNFTPLIVTCTTFNPHHKKLCWLQVHVQCGSTKGSLVNELHDNSIYWLIWNNPGVQSPCLYSMLTTEQVDMFPINNTSNIVYWHFRYCVLQLQRMYTTTSKVVYCLSSVFQQVTLMLYSTQTEKTMTSWILQITHGHSGVTLCWSCDLA